MIGGGLMFENRTSATGRQGAGIGGPFFTFHKALRAMRKRKKKKKKEKDRSSGGGGGGSFLVGGGAGARGQPSRMPGRNVFHLPRHIR